MMAGRELKTAEVENARTRRGFGKRLESVGVVGCGWMWLDVVGCEGPDHGDDGSSFANSANTKKADLETIGACLH